MKKFLICTLCGLLFLSMKSISQPTLNVPDAPAVKATLGRNSVIKENKEDILEITGIGTSTFATSSTFSGTASSYKYSLKINVALLTSSANKESFQLVFYSPEEALPLAATSEAGVTYAYYPISLYEAIKLKLDQSLAAKKKVQLKVTLRTDGFREAVLIL